MNQIVQADCQGAQGIEGYWRNLDRYMDYSEVVKYQTQIETMFANANQDDFTPTRRQYCAAAAAVAAKHCHPKMLQFPCDTLEI